MGSQTATKILIVGDSDISSKMFEAALVKRLKEVKGHKILIKGINLKVGEFFRLPERLETQENKIIAEVLDADILVVNMAPITSRILENAKNLKLICSPRSGPVNIDIEAANKRGIPVFYSPDRTTNSVAEFTLGLIFSLARNIPKASTAFKNGSVLTDRECTGIELKGKKLGIVGFGHVGRAVAAKARALNMEILVHDPYVSENIVYKKGGNPVSLDRLLGESDFVTLHVRLTPHTVNLIGERELALMKKATYLINTARGLLVDEEALYKALREKKLAGAALDVLVRDKNPETPLAQLENVLLTPHIGASTCELLETSPIIVAKQVTAFLKGEEWKFVAEAKSFIFERRLILEGKVTE